jgi:hypothetical protein
MKDSRRFFTKYVVSTGKSLYEGVYNRFILCYIAGEREFSVPYQF